MPNLRTLRQPLLGFKVLGEEERGYIAKRVRFFPEERGYIPRKSAVIFQEECGYISGRARLYFRKGVVIFPEERGYIFAIKKNDSYLTRVLLKVVSVLFLLLKGFIKDNKVLPRVLNLNLDNCWRLVFKFPLAPMGVLAPWSVQALLSPH